jgi:hypothetical protein
VFGPPVVDDARTDGPSGTARRVTSRRLRVRPPCRNRGSGCHYPLRLAEGCRPPQYAHFHRVEHHYIRPEFSQHLSARELTFSRRLRLPEPPSGHSQPWSSVVDIRTGLHHGLQWSTSALSGNAHGLHATTLTSMLMRSKKFWLSTAKDPWPKVGLQHSTDLRMTGDDSASSEYETRIWCRTPVGVCQRTMPWNLPPILVWRSTQLTVDVHVPRIAL